VTETSNGTAVLARALVDLRDRTIQKTRIQFSNRVSAAERGADNGTYSYIFQKWLKKFEELEKDLDESISDMADEIPIIERMVKVKGVGKTLAMKIAVMIDIERADTVSSLWKYAGYGVTDGERDRPKTGEKLCYNKRLKSTCYLVASSFLKSNSPYRAIYDAAREQYENKVDKDGKPWTKAHQHNAAMRKMIKIWLSHLWMVWREMEGLPTNKPWVFNENPHHRYITPEEMGW
jgi:hypothetical protein